ncbi:ABC transporter substrate-binding protein [Aliagarivorans taiwanensis]|uniref:ABC transporter substrate-binding protein n=1 Tax=Aliagarivorans taiwanensis TaxID=561966 RepID=UPI00040A4D63|nr:ABC transporter substrate-binding protein [Aliagarivorans taiwanensis]
MKLNYLLLSLLICFGAKASDCGPITIADMTYASGSIFANIDRFILEHGYGCDAELVPGDTMPTTAAMVQKGKPDIAPELWTNSIADLIETNVENGVLVIAGNSLSDGGEEGLWVPSYLVEANPELATMEGVIKHAELFTHPEDDRKSAVYGCPSGWKCQIIVGNLFKAFDLEARGFELVDPGSSAGLSGSIVKAYERQEPWLGYYWAPTAILGKYDMVKVDFQHEFDEQHWYGCIIQDDCELPKVSPFPASPVRTVVTANFDQRYPKLMEYLNIRGIGNGDMNKLLAWKDAEQADTEETMYHFLEQYSHIWKPWLSEERARKVEAAL